MSPQTNVTTVWMGIGQVGEREDARSSDGRGLGTAHRPQEAAGGRSLAEGPVARRRKRMYPAYRLMNMDGYGAVQRLRPGGNRD